MHIKERQIQCASLCTKPTFYLKNGWSEIIDKFSNCNNKKIQNVEVLSDAEIIELIKGELYEE